MIRRVARAAVGFLGVAVPACGARTELAARGGDASADACPVAPTCPDATSGTWRFTTSLGQTGYFFLFDGSKTCGETADAFFVVLGSEDSCSRSGDYVVETQSPSALSGASDNLGGSVAGACGDPTNESLHFTLADLACDGTRELSMQDSSPQSPLSLEAMTTRCRCDLAWTPCVDPLPADPCAP